MVSVLQHARTQVLEHGVGLSQDHLTQVLHLPDDALGEALALAHEVRMRWCGPEVEVEEIISLKTGGCAEDCHFCAQPSSLDQAVRTTWLDVPDLVEAAVRAAAAGSTEFAIVASGRGPSKRIMAQLHEAIPAIRSTAGVDVNCSLGLLTPKQAEELAALGVHKYNHNLETARSHFPQVVTAHTWDERRHTLDLVRAAGMLVCSGGIIGLGETLPQRAEFIAQLADARPDESPINFLDPRPGTPLAGLPNVARQDALRAVVAFRLAMPAVTLRFAGGREITLGDDGTRDALLGGVNGMITGNYLTTAGRSADQDFAMLRDLRMPVRPAVTAP